MKERRRFGEAKRVELDGCVRLVVGPEGFTSVEVGVPGDDAEWRDLAVVISELFGADEGTIPSMQGG